MFLEGSLLFFIKFEQKNTLWKKITSEFGGGFPLMMFMYRRGEQEGAESRPEGKNTPPKESLPLRGNKKFILQTHKADNFLRGPTHRSCLSPPNVHFF